MSQTSDRDGIDLSEAVTVELSDGSVVIYHPHEVLRDDWFIESDVAVDVTEHN